MRNTKLTAVVGGREVPLPSDKDEAILPVSDFNEIAASVINFFTNANFPNEPIIGKITTSDLTKADFGTGGFVEYKMQIKVLGERSPDWYTKWALLSSILAEERPTGLPRKVNSAVQYVDRTPAREGHMMMLLDITDIRLELKDDEGVVLV